MKNAERKSNFGRDFKLISLALALILFIPVIYLSTLLISAPSSKISIAAEGLITFDGVIFGFQALILQSQYDAVISFVDSIKNKTVKKNQYIERAYKKMGERMMLKLISLILLIFGSFFCVMAIVGPAYSISIALILTYISCYISLETLFHMVMSQIVRGHRIMENS